MDDGKTRSVSGAPTAGAFIGERIAVPAKLSAVARTLLAERIAVTDGITFAQAHRQTVRFLRSCCPADRSHPLSAIEQT